MKTLLSLLIILISYSAVADEVLHEHGINTTMYTLTFPKGWVLDSKKTPVQVRGPDSELMLITQILPSPDSEAPKSMNTSVQMQEFWRARIKPTIINSISQEGMKTVDPYKEKKMNGMPFFSGCSHVIKQKSFLCVYGLIGKGGAVFLLTVEGWNKDERNAKKVTLHMLKNIKWKI